VDDVVQVVDLEAKHQVAVGVGETDVAPGDEEPEQSDEDVDPAERVADHSVDRHGVGPRVGPHDIQLLCER
jgi:hypothetical protein